MLIEKFMTPDPITVDDNVSVTEAAKLMKKENVRRFPVLRNGKLVGIVTDRDLRSAAPSQVINLDASERQLMPELYDLLSKVEIRDIMSRDVTAIGPKQSIVAAALLMLKHHISGMPVIDSQGRLSGIITEADIFKALVDFSGIHLGKTLVDLYLEDHPGSIKEVADVIREHGGRLASIMTSYSSEDPHFRRVYIRIRDLPTKDLEALKKELHEKFELVSMIDDEVVIP